MNKLSLEQQFSLRSFETKVQQMSHSQAQNFCLLLYEQMMVKETLYKELLKGAMGIAPPPIEIPPKP